MQSPGPRPELEARVRSIAADHLGVNEGELTPALSLVDELAVDSLDLAELAATLEEELAIALPDAVLEAVRTYGDLVGAVQFAIDAHESADAERGVPPIRVVARLARATPPGPPLERSGELTPYFAQTLVDDALRLGAGSRVDVAVSAPRDDAAVFRVRAQLAPLAAQGIEVHVQRDPLGARHRHTSAA